MSVVYILIIGYSEREKIGYVKLNSNNFIGNYRDYLHSKALRVCERVLNRPLGSYAAMTITKKPLKRLKVLNEDNRTV